MTFKIGDKVITSGLGTGTITRIGDDGSHHIALDRGGTWSAKSVADLVPIRERARTAGEEPELEHRMIKLEIQHEALRKAMASELHNLEQRLDRLEGGEEEAPAVAEQQPVADHEALTRPWLELTSAQRETIRRWMVDVFSAELPPRLHRVAAESALMAIPGLLADLGQCRRSVAEADREIEGLRGRQRELEAERTALTAALADGKDGTLIELAQRRMQELRAHRGLHWEAAKWWREVHAEDPPEPEVSPTEQRIGDALQTLAKLVVAPGEPYPAKTPEPDDVAPGAAETIRLLQERVEELEQSVAARGDRSPEWVEGVERTLYRLAQAMGTRGLWKAAVERAIELRDQHDAITCRLRAIVPWDDAPSERNETAEKLLDAIEGPARLVMLLAESTTEGQLMRLANGLRFVIGNDDHASPATLVADLLEHLVGEGL